MRIAYFDCFAGASGDMILGALLDAGLELGRLQKELSKLGLPGFSLSERQVLKNGLGGTQAIVEINETSSGHHHHRHLTDIKEIINNSSLDNTVKENSLIIFTRLAEAEAKVHRTGIENIHFHEVGAWDAIVDIVGAVVGLKILGIDRLYCSPIHLGSGMISCSHGILPVPAPATAELIKGKPAFSTEVTGELLTPTGAAILTTLATAHGPMSPMVSQRVGYGAGKAELTLPNLLRLTIGEAEALEDRIVTKIFELIDSKQEDLAPEIYNYLNTLVNKQKSRVFKGVNSDFL